MMGRRILVTGGRNETDFELVQRSLLDAAALLSDIVPGPITLIHGGCYRRMPNGEIDPTRSVDWIAHQIAEHMGWITDPHPVTREEYRRKGNQAFYDRNQAMVDLRPDICVVLPGGGGTADCARRAEAAGIPLLRAAVLV
jgi:hypothetical protein